MCWENAEMWFCQIHGNKNWTSVFFSFFRTTARNKVKIHHVWQKSTVRFVCFSLSDVFGNKLQLLKLQHTKAKFQWPNTLNTCLGHGQIFPIRNCFSTPHINLPEMSQTENEKIMDQKITWSTVQWVEHCTAKGSPDAGGEGRGTGDHVTQRESLISENTEWEAVL